MFAPQLLPENCHALNVGDIAMDEDRDRHNPIHAKFGIMLGMFVGSGWALLALLQPVV
jgi:hypothetical protein